MRKSRINSYLNRKYKHSKKKRTNSKNKAKASIKPCNIINVHGEKLVLPTSYPGNLYTHIFLNPDRHQPMEAFSDDYLRKLYKKYRVKCYGK